MPLVIAQSAQLPLQLTAAGNLKVAIEEGTVLPSNGSGQFDAFGRIRVSEPFTVFDSKQLFDKQPLFWDDAVASGAGTSSTYNTNQASTTLAVSNLTAGRRVRQTFRRFNYQPGKSHLVTMTGVIGTPAAGITRRIGLLDENNGVYFVSLPTTMAVGVRTFTSGVANDVTVPQANWNLDKLDGTGASGITLVPSNTQVFIIDFQWLGSGSIFFGFQFGRSIVYCHKIDNANSLSIVYMGSPNLPLRYEIANSGAGGAASILHICSAVVVEGGRQTTGYERADDRGISPLVANTTDIFPLLALQLQPGFAGADIQLMHLTVNLDTNKMFNWYLLLNPTVAGGVFAFTPVANSAVQIAKPSNALTVTGGTKLTSESVSAGGSASGANAHFDIATVFRPGFSFAGVADTLVLGVQLAVATGTNNFYGSLNWNETS